MSDKLIHYSRYGYEGKFMYKSVCGKEVKTHQDHENSSIHPEETNCPDCMVTKEYLEDLANLIKTPYDVKRRIYIESDILHANEFKSAINTMESYAKEKGEKTVPRGFSEVLNYAWHYLDKTWRAVKNANEIWATSSLVPLCNDYMGAPVIFNGMCERAIKEKVTGKSIILLTHLKYVYWHMIDVPQMKKAFKKNALIMYNDDYELEKVDVTKIKEQ